MLRRRREAEQERQPRLDCPALGLFLEEPGNLRSEFLRRLLGCVRLQDAHLVLDHLAERPEGHAVAVRQRAALPPGDELGALRDELEELADEAALADAGDADEGDELNRALVLRPLERAREQPPFVIAAHERRLALGEV